PPRTPPFPSTTLFRSADRQLRREVPRPLQVEHALRLADAHPPTGDHAERAERHPDERLAAAERGVEPRRAIARVHRDTEAGPERDRKSTRLNSSHVAI